MPKKSIKPRRLEDLDGWIKEYKQIRPLYEEFCEKLKALLEDLLSRESIRYQIVEARVKSVKSLREKLQRNGKILTDPLRQVPDFAGLRIIVYYLEDVKKACSILDREFNVNHARSVNKRETLAPDQFGYLSVHNIVSLADNRAQLPEWSSFRDLVAEIQVRTVLQHAWAAISHALQYKREADIPESLRRKLLRLSGLLELTDEQFSDLRREQNALRREISERIEERDLDIPIDALSIREFFEKSEIAKEIVKIAKTADLSITPGRENLVLQQLLAACEMVGLKGIRALEEKLVSLKPKAKSFFSEFYRLEGKSKQKIYGGPGHWLAVIIIGAHRRKFTQKQIRRKIGWTVESYALNAFEAGRVFEDA